jgi:hypothetical protein
MSDMHDSINEVEGNDLTKVKGVPTGVNQLTHVKN